MTVRRFVPALALSAIAVGGGLGASASACPPAVRLVGDADLVAAIAGVLHARGIATSLPACVSITARVGPRADGIAISIEAAEPIEREVREVETAATVIESFARDETAPLLAARAVPPPDPPEARAASARAAADDQAPPAPRHPRGLHLFAGLESSFASDSSSWLGMHAGGCLVVGIVCVAVRARSSSVIQASDMQAAPRRQSWELLAGVDIPFALRGWLVTPGMAFGVSGMSSRVDTIRQRTNGLRAEAHATVSIPLTRRFALDMRVACNLLQPLHFDERTGPLPEEPWGFARLGVGLRYGER